MSMIKRKSLFFYVLIIAFIPFYSHSYYKENKIGYERKDLSIFQWFLREKGSKELIKAEVPGSVQLNLYRAGIIEDPFYRDNEEKNRWIGEKDWEYLTEFSIPEEILKKENIEIVFKGLDTFADVFLNEKKILVSDNFFRDWRVNVKGILKKRNKLRILFTSPIKIIKEKKSEYPYGKPTADYIFVRKPAYQFGWDWAPVYITMGIWKPVYIESWNNLRLKDVRVVQKEIKREYANLDFIFDIISTKNQKAKLVLSNKKEKFKIKKNILLKKGDNKITINYILLKPKLWWPHNIGEPYLYDFKAKLIQGNRIRGKWSKKIGIREIKLMREKDQLGESFYFKINGRPVFIKGANFIPQDVFLSRIRSKQYEKLIKDAVKSNINMLRIWGGGFYENDIFYELCDKYGILVWQDFMFACALYPADKNFLENVKTEAIYNIKRLRNHPSLALWCGNNEIYEGWGHWGWQKMYSKKNRKKIVDDYNKLFLNLLPELVKKYDSNRPYIHTSPLTNWGEKKLNIKGDVHYWGVWHGQEPFEVFEKKEKIGRFVSEFGFQSFPDMKTIKEFTEKEDRTLNSEIIKAHEKHPIGLKIIKKYMKEYFDIPVLLEDFVYMSQLLQAYGIGMGIESQRRAKPMCMGTLYWQFNDCWPVISWSGIDWRGRWKALQYKVRKLYSNIIISPIVKENLLRVYVISDSNEDKKVELQLFLKDFFGNNLFSESRNILLKAGRSKVYYEETLENLLKNAKKDEVFLYAILKDKYNKTLSERYFYFVKPKDLKLVKPVVKISVERDFDGYNLIIKTDKLAKYMYLSYENYNGFFTNNYFDLMPGITKKVKFITTATLKNPIKELKIMVYE